MAAIEQNIVGSCTFHTNHVLFQLGILIYTQLGMLINTKNITDKCQNLLKYVCFCTYGHLHDPIFFAIKIP